MDLDNIVARAIKNVWDKKIEAGDLDADLWRHNAAEIWRGLDDGLGKQSASTPYTDPDAATAHALRHSVAVFVAFKNHHNIADMVQAAAESKDFTDFKAKALALNAAYNVSWLKAEYETANGAAQMAVKWNDFQTRKKALPYLRYETVGDARVRLAHRALDGITRPVDDAFWDEWFPPNGWRCRCDVAQVAGGETPLPAALPDEKQTPPAFRINPGKTGEIVGPEHPYYKGVPDEQRANILRGLSDILHEKDYETLRADPAFAQSLEKTKDMAAKHPALTQPEIAAIHRYSDRAYRLLNRVLRGLAKSTRELEALARVIDFALYKMPAAPTVSYRALSAGKAYLDMLEKAFETGLDIVEAGFLSSDLNPEVAAEFGQYLKKDGETTVVMLVIGQKGRNIADISQFGTTFGGNQREILFGRGSKWKVTDLQKRASAWYVTIEQQIP